MDANMLYPALPAPTDYISVVVNFKNLRFMTLIKEDCLVSDLVEEAENTFARLCSVKFKFKTLRNSVNAVLPHWYPVAPLIKNQDEIFAFTGSTAEVLNADLTKHGNNNTMSPLGLADSGFTSPTTKLGTTTAEALEPISINIDRGGRQGRKNKSDENLSQDELLSEIFSLKDHNLNGLRPSNIQGTGSGNKHNESLRKNNTNSEKEGSLKVNKGKMEVKQLSGKTRVKDVEETIYTPRNELEVNQKKLINQKKEEIKKTSVDSESDSSSDSSDESENGEKRSQQVVGKAKSESSDDSSDLSETESINNAQGVKSTEMKGDISANQKEKEKINSDTKDDTKKSDTKSKITKTKKRQSSESSSSSDDADEGKTAPKTDNAKTSNSVKVMKSENMKETKSGSKHETKERKSSFSSVSSWSSSDDEEVKTTNNNTLKQKDKSPVADCDNSKDVSSKNEIQTVPAPPKCEDKGKDNTKKMKGKRKMNNNDEDGQTNLDVPPSPAKSVGVRKRKEGVPASPAKSVGHKRRKESLPASPAKSVGHKSRKESVPASPAQSVSRDKKTGLPKTKADLTKVDQVQDDDTDSKSSVSTLKPPFTQLPGKEDVKHGEDDVEKKGKYVKKKGKHRSDKKTGDADTSSEQPNEPETAGLPTTETKATSRKSAERLSTSKVAHWLLSNPAPEDEKISDETQKMKTRSKNKDQTKQNADASKESKENSESIVEEATLLSRKGKLSSSQKRKVKEESDQEQSIKSKKHRKTQGNINEKQIDEETEANQDKVIFKTPAATTKKGKKASLSLPKKSKGLSALAEDESDYSTGFTKRLKKKKLTHSTAGQMGGFLTPSDTIKRNASETKTPKSRTKKTSSSQATKTVEMNQKEQEFLDNGVMNLDTLLNDETIKW